MGLLPLRTVLDWVDVPGYPRPFDLTQWRVAGLIWALWMRHGPGSMPGRYFAALQQHAAAPAEVQSPDDSSHAAQRLHSLLLQAAEAGEPSAVAAASTLQSGSCSLGEAILAWGITAEEADGRALAADPALEQEHAKWQRVQHVAAGDPEGFEAACSPAMAQLAYAAAAAQEERWRQGLGADAAERIAAEYPGAS